MRTKTVTINGKAITISEYKIKALKNEILPKLTPAYQAIVSGDTSQLIDRFGEQLKNVFPELADVNFDECYPSEIEEFVEAWVDVNFTGLKRLVGPLLSLAKKGQQMPELGLAKPLGSQTIGKNYL